MSKELIIIAGIAKNWVIGKNNELPWHLKEDLKRFKELTFGHPTIMGRKTYESILSSLGKPLPGRTSIVLTSNKEYPVKENTVIANSLQEAISKAHQLSDKAYVIGGQNVYQQALPIANKLEITHIHRNFDGDAFFPKITGEDWLEIKRHDKKGEHFEYSFSTYERRPSAIKRNKKGMFIAIEGIDGCGKSTQIRKLVHHIFNKSKYHHIILTRNPYKNVNIRDILHQDSDPYSQAEKLADSFIQDRVQQAEEIIRPNLEKGHFVISDRYKLSTISYQSTQGLDMQSLIDKQSSLPIPDITFIIDVPVEEAKIRMSREDTSIRGKEHKFEADSSFLEKLRKNLLNAAEKLMQNNEKVFIINGLGNPEEIAEEISQILDKEMDSGIKIKKAANIVFYDGQGNFLLQDRREISKWGEEYHFFGGHTEKEETPEETLKRELQEELGITLENFKLFKYWPHYAKKVGCYYETSTYLAPMPVLENLNVKDGKAELVNINNIDNLKMVPGYKEILKEIYQKNLSN